MLFNCFSKVYLAMGYTDLRNGVDGLAKIVQLYYELNPFQKDVLFLFCGRKNDRIKGLVWEGDGFLLLYKRLEDGHFQWPRNRKELAAITPEQLQNLMSGLSVFSTIRRVHPRISA